ncbi:hypothetical protein [Vibrio sp. B1Z05]|uniref:hypothetical protein n=1 Tax=Vibrio sp. B1Z05 TaxID=2654980 RepID=UPI001562B367|nr:hypothetical protein [Vibrio sp. B1Z05]
MIVHLEQISSATKKGRHAVVIMDGAGWHTEDIANKIIRTSTKLSRYSATNVMKGHGLVCKGN